MEVKGEKERERVIKTVIVCQRAFMCDKGEN